MPSTFLGINTAYTGLSFYQAANTTIAHNVANASTEGYTRQQVIARATNAIRTNQSFGMMGTGVTVDRIEQMRNAYYDSKYRLNAAKLGNFSIQNDYQLQFQSYIDEIASESGYTTMLSDITSAIEDLTIDPCGETERTQYVNALDSFTDLVNEVAENLRQSQIDANDEIQLTVSRINSIAQQVFKLGQEITALEIDGTVANDLRDKRNLLLDELSGLVNMEAIETHVTYGVGDKRVESPATTLEVRINGELLCDSMGYRELTVVPRPKSVNQNDIEGLVDVYWATECGGAQFKLNNPNLTGKLRGLYEMRDGNNCQNLQGEITEVTANTVTLTMEPPVRIEDLNIDSEGSILLNYSEYYYNDWSAEYSTNAKGETVIDKLTLLDVKYRVTEDDAQTSSSLVVGTLASRDLTAIDPSIVGRLGMQGDSVDSKGIPYYMQQLNEFVRTLSKYMNKLHTSGADKQGNPGLDLFTAVDTKGDDFVLKDSVADTGILKAGDSSYWRINAMNWGVNTQIMSDNDKVVVSTLQDIEQNNESAHGVLDSILYGFSDDRMFTQGTPFQFLNSVSSSVAVDTLKTDMFIENMNYVVTSIDTQRQSISSVDTNEEAANLLVYRNGYNLSSKVMSTLNEMLNKLINETGL